MSGTASATTDGSHKLMDICRRRGIPLTHQRRVIYESISGREDHPAVDQIYDAVRKKLPQISRMTVYRVLDLFVDLEIISKVCHPGVAIRFDPRTEPHHHLICMRCARLYDLDDTGEYRISIPETGTLGFEVRSFAIQFKGVCKECLSLESGNGKSGSGKQDRPV
jgi:Fe2+ or Zn2+ uptake regulation protein